MNNEKKPAVMTVVYGPFHQGIKFRGLEILSLFNQSGLVDEGTLMEAFQEEGRGEPRLIGEGTIGPFENLESLQKFAFNLCQRLGNVGVSLVSIDEYNDHLMGSYRGDELKRKLEEEGSFIKNPDAGKGGFFNKIFNN